MRAPLRIESDVRRRKLAMRATITRRRPPRRECRRWRRQWCSLFAKKSTMSMRVADYDYHLEMSHVSSHVGEGVIPSFGLVLNIVCPHGIATCYVQSLDVLTFNTRSSDIICLLNSLNCRHSRRVCRQIWTWSLSSPSFMGG